MSDPLEKGILAALCLSVALPPEDCRQIERLIQQRDEAKTWAKEFQRIARAVWTEDWESDDVDKLLDDWPTLPDWLKEQNTDG